MIQTFFYDRHDRGIRKRDHLGSSFGRTGVRGLSALPGKAPGDFWCLLVGQKARGGSGMQYPAPTIKRMCATVYAQRSHCRAGREYGSLVLSTGPKVPKGPRGVPNPPGPLTAPQAPEGSLRGASRESASQRAYPLGTRDEGRGRKTGHPPIDRPLSP